LLKIGATKPPRCGGGISHGKAACFKPFDKLRVKEHMKDKSRQEARSS